jgi:Anaphase-promoting complex subunit 4 WD40 domain
LIYEKADKGLHLTSLALHPDGNLLAVGDSHGKLHFIEILSNEEMMVFDTNYV